MKYHKNILNSGSQGFYSVLRLYATILRSLSANPAPSFTLPLRPLSRIFESHSFTVSIMGVIASLVFLILPWFPQHSSIILGSLYLSTILLFKADWFPLTLKISTFLFSHQKSQNRASSAN